MVGFQQTSWGVWAEEIALRLLGKPDFSYPGEFRYGNKGSLKVSIAPSPYAGTWTDFEAGIGGGMPQLIERYGGYVDDFLWNNTLPPPTMPKKLPANGDRGLTDYAIELWEAGEEIPIEDNHPARRWLARRKLWRPGLALPKAIRWIPERILVMVAHPLDWLAAWPELPKARAIQTIEVNEDGTPGKDSGGLNKRSFGPTSGLVAMFGNPESAINRITEGVADGLAIAMRYPDTVWVTLGVGGYGRWESMVYLAIKECVIHADNDNVGLVNAQKFVRQVVKIGGKADYLIPTRGKDFAEEMLDFSPLPAPEIVQSYADTLLEMHPEWPWGEISRVSVIATGE